MQAYQKKYTDMRCWHVDYAVSNIVLLPTFNLRLQGRKKFRNRCIRPFKVLERIGNTAYHLDLAGCWALGGVHNVFQVSLLHDWQSNGLRTNILPIQVDDEHTYKVVGIKGHRECNGKM